MNRAIVLFERAGIARRSRAVRRVRHVRTRPGDGNRRRTLSTCGAPSHSRRSTRSASSLASAGIDPRRRHDGRRARRSSRALHDRKAQGLHGEHGVHVPRPRPIDRSRPGGRAAPGRSSWRPGPISPSPIPNLPAPRPDRTPESAATRGSTTTRPCGRGCGWSAGRSAAPTTVRWRSPTTTRSSTGQSPIRAGPRVVRQERQPAAAGRGQLVRARLRRHDRAATTERAAPVADGCGTCRTLHRRLPDRRDRCAGRDRRAPLPRLGAAEARERSPSSTARRSATASTAVTTARTCARITSGSAVADRRPSRTSRRMGRRARLLDRRRRRARTLRPLVPRRSGSALGAAQRARRARQRRRPGDPSGGLASTSTATVASGPCDPIAAPNTPHAAPTDPTSPRTAAPAGSA